LPLVDPTSDLDLSSQFAQFGAALDDALAYQESDMSRRLFSSIAVGLFLLVPVTAQTAPVRDSGTIVIADKGGRGGGSGGGGGSMKGAGGGHGGSMRGDGGGGGGAAMRSRGGGGDGPAMRGPSGSRSVDRGGRGGGDDSRAFRGSGDKGAGRAYRSDRGEGKVDRGPRRADPGFKKGNRDRGHAFRGGKSHSRDYIRRRGHRYVWGPGIAFWYYGGLYYGDCDWLRRRAEVTGSAYWWNRYEQCVDW
jgi:hypothetical protein